MDTAIKRGFAGRDAVVECSSLVEKGDKLTCTPPGGSELVCIGPAKKVDGQPNLALLLARRRCLFLTHNGASILVIEKFPQRTVGMLALMLFGAVLLCPVHPYILFTNSAVLHVG